MITGDASKPWYHGSPHRLSTLRAGSTLTQDRDLARIFSHKPTLVEVKDPGVNQPIRHNGTLSGFLYVIAEEVAPEDVVPHPRSTMAGGQEWITTRELRLTVIGATQPVEAEWLTEEAIQGLLRQIRSSQS